MKRVRDIINLREDESPSFTDADGDTGPYANNQDGKVTGGGRVQNYPVSASNISWIKTQGGPFAFGYLGGHTLENLTLELLGSDLSASVIKDANAEYESLGTRQEAEQAAWAAADYPDSLLAIVNATAAERSALLNRIGAYIIGGTINNPDPYELDHPEISSVRDYKRKKKKDYGNIAANQGPSTPVKSDTDGRLIPNPGAGRAGEVRMKNPEMGLPPIKKVEKNKGDTLIAGTGPGGEPGYGSNTPKGLPPSAAERDAKNMRYDPKMGIWAPNINLPKKVENKGKTQVAHYEPEGEVLSENRKRIFRDLKKPVEVPELPKKYKMNFAGKYSAQNTPDQTASQISDALVASGNAKGQRWKQKDKEWQGYETTERLNVVYDKVGHSDQYWEMIVGDNSKKKKDRELQEKLNIIAHEKALMQENPNYETPFNEKYIDEQETLSADKDPLFKKVSKSLNKSIDYSKKPSKKGYPNDPPPKMINGYHPDLVNGQRVSNYYNRLDPASAKAMPKTGNDSIDSKVDLAKNGEYPKDSPAASTAAKRHGLDKLGSNPRTDANVKKDTNEKEKARKLKILLGKKT